MVPQKQPRMGKNKWKKNNWEKYSSILERLYMEEKKGLPAVMKVMAERFNFRPTYQFGVIWRWKKYNLDGMKPSRSRSRNAPLRNDPSDSSEEDTIEEPNVSEVPGRDIASLRAPLSELLTNLSLDEKSLGTLRQGDSGVVSQCLRLFFHWCDKEIQKTQSPFPYMVAAEAGTDNPDSKYELDVGVFIYLLDCYIRSQDSSSEHDNWDSMAKEIIGFCPIKMLFIMSTLIVVIVSSAQNLRQGEISFEPHHVFKNVAKFGINEISRNRWRDEKLVTEFCNEFESILKDYANYGKELEIALFRYMTQEWPEPQVNEDLGLGDGEELVIWPDDIQDEGLYSIEDNSPWDGLVGGT
ncbi:hypothetical protein F4823DRAFT_566421 [Ustulina deusta]|nr:hypothetical protein F4823DRAFT_566421 [Ustulina deusta]